MTQYSTHLRERVRGEQAGERRQRVLVEAAPGGREPRRRRAPPAAARRAAPPHAAEQGHVRRRALCEYTYNLMANRPSYSYSIWWWSRSGVPERVHCAFAACQRSPEPNRAQNSRARLWADGTITSQSSTTGLCSALKSNFVNSLLFFFNARLAFDRYLIRCWQ